VLQRKDDIAKLLCSWGADVADISATGQFNWESKGVSAQNLKLWQVNIKSRIMI
jgi:hypothetical protein